MADEQQQLDAEQITIELNTAALGVFRAANRLQRLMTEFDGEGGELGVGTRYAIALDDELAAIYAEAQHEGTRPPAEDIRGAMARSRVRQRHPELDADYRRLQTEMKATQIWISSQRAVISARQSVLNAVRALGG